MLNNPVRRFFGTSAVFLLSVCLMSPAHAAVDLVDLLVPDASLLVGDSLVFDQFSYSSTGSMTSAAGVKVATITDAAGNFGIRFVGGFSDLASSPGASTANFTYRVSATGGSLGLTEAMLMGNPASAGLGSMTITQSFAGIPTTLQIFDIQPGSIDLVDSAAFPSALSSVNVALSLVGDATTRGVTASFIDQTYTQSSQNVIPEPASVVIWLGTLLVCGILPLTYRRWGAQPVAAAKRL
jgi:hypothetical protein